MTIELTLRQQLVVKPSAYLVVNEITGATGIDDLDLVENLKSAFLISRAAGKETLVRVCTPQDYVTYQPYPAPPSELIRWQSEVLVDYDGPYRIIFNPVPDYWQTVHNGEDTDTYDIDIVLGQGYGTVTPPIRFPSSSPDGEPIQFGFYTQGGVAITDDDLNPIIANGIPTRTSADVSFRDNVIYSFFSTAVEAESAALAVRTQLTSLARQLNAATEDFDLTIDEVF